MWCRYSVRAVLLVLPANRRRVTGRALRDHMLRHRVVRMQRRLLFDAAAGERSATLIIRVVRGADLGLARSTRVSLWVRRRRDGRLALIPIDNEPEVSVLVAFIAHIYSLMQHCVCIPAVRLAR